MYVDLSSKMCLVVGAGEVAVRKVEVLLDFDAKVLVVAEQFAPEMEAYQRMYPDRVTLQKRSFEPKDCEGRFLVVAATNHPGKNHEIAVYCKEHGIAVNAVDQKEDCTFIFPSYVRQKDLVASFSSAGKSPLLTQILKDEEKSVLTPFVGELNECLGAVRDKVKAIYQTEGERKAAYRRIYQYAMQRGEIPDEQKIQELLNDL